jgi:DNA adenine methylase
VRTKKNEISAFSWYGGKTYHLNWLLPVINGIDHKSYVESFAGSAAVLFNKIPSEIEVYNDVHGDVVNFFKVLRNNPDELLNLLELTPYSRQEFAESCDLKINCDPLEQARRFFVRARQVRSGLATKATPGRWSYTKKDCRGKRALPINQWLNSIDGLGEICERLKNIQIENLDALDVIQRYDTSDALHYIDPPYLMSSRTGGENYSHEYNEEQHLNLLNLLFNIKGKVVLSGYINEMYPSMLKDWKESRRLPKLANTTLQDGVKKERQEVIWTNFDFQPSGEGWE